MLDYRMVVQRTPYNYSEEAINSQNSKLVSYVRWLSKKHMYATCPRLRVQAVLFLTQTGRGRESWLHPVITISVLSMKQEAREELQLRRI